VGASIGSLHVPAHGASQRPPFGSSQPAVQLPVQTLAQMQPVEQSADACSPFVHVPKQVPLHEPAHVAGAVSEPLHVPLHVPGQMP
jgi:hypothetical protein